MELSAFKEWDENNWKDWMDGELSNTRYAYIKKIEFMIGEYRNEIQKTEEYNGRQLLELIQNADDAGEDLSDSKILIILKENKLIIANSGTPFSPDGIKSLMTSNNSPKIKKANQIGYKGLGFRSILNWSKSTNILSRGLSIEFSREHAVKFLKDMIRSNPEFKYPANEEFQIATLAVPKVTQRKVENNLTYDTWIEINFDDKEIYEDIQKQINTLGKEILLFLNNISEIKIESIARNETLSLVRTNKRFIEVKSFDYDNNLNYSKKWEVYSQEGKLPTSLRFGEYASQYNYQLKIAVSNKLDDNINRLFSFFKTDVRFPFPAIIHGTFKLDSNRNHLVKDKVNEFLLDRLAELMVKTAISLKQKAKVSWSSLKLLSKRNMNFDPKVEEMGFYEKLIEKIKENKLIPVIGNKYVSIKESPYFYNVNFSNILNYEEFCDLALYTNDEDIIRLINDLEIREYPSKEFVKKINKISSKIIDIEVRARLISLIADKWNFSKDIDKEDMPNLLIDEKGLIINSNSDAILPPERKNFQVPSDLSINFVNSKLVAELSTIYKINSGRELRSRMECFNVQEYAFAPIIRKIVSHARKLIKKTNNSNFSCIPEMIVSIWNIYKENTTEKFPDNLKIPLLTRMNKLRNADELYLGKEYPNGQIMDNLYSHIDNSVFLANKETLGLGNENIEEIQEFIFWLGVSKFPRIKLKEFKGDDYENFVLKSLDYPILVEDEYIKSYEHMIEYKQYSSEITIQYIEELDKILLNSNFEDILIWIISDYKIKKILIEKIETDKNSKFGIWFKSKQGTRNLRYNLISSYILWKFINTKWIKTDNDIKVEPKICCMSKTLSSKIFSPLVEVLYFNIKNQKFVDKNIKSEDVEHILSKIGVAKDFSDLSTDALYSILLKLPNVDPEGQKAKTIYRQIILDKNPSDIDTSDEKYKRFMKEGNLFGFFGESKGYFSRKELNYIENITFCKEIINQKIILDISRRMGARNVKKIFGVEQLSWDTLQCEILDFDLHPLNSEFQMEIDNFKPYIYVYRKNKDHKRANLNALKKLRINICTRLKSNIIHKNKKKLLNLNPYEFITGKNSIIYLLLDCNQRYTNLNNLKNDFDFCDSISEIISTILKVSEIQTEVREMFSKNKNQRDKIIAKFSEGTIDVLKNCRKLLGQVMLNKFEFWSAILRIKYPSYDIDETESDKSLLLDIKKYLVKDTISIEKYYQKIDYDDYNNPNNIPIFKNIITELKISQEDFKKYSDVQIDFSEYYLKELKNFKRENLNLFKNAIYKNLCQRNINNQKKFIDIFNKYDSVEIFNYLDFTDLFFDIRNAYNIFLNKEFSEFNLIIGNLEKLTKTPLSNIFNKNKDAFINKLEASGGAYEQDIDKFIEDIENKSLIYFGQFEVLTNLFYEQYSKPSKEESEDKKIITKKKIIEIKGKAIEFDDNDYSNVLNNIDEDFNHNKYSIQDYISLKPEAFNKKERSKSSHKVGSSAKLNTEIIGFMGERYTYRALVKEYGQEKVNWVSNNAKKARVNPEGNDNEGYDIEYIDKQGKLKYVEVKSSSDNSLMFSISKGEITFGQKNKENYEIVIVQNVKDENIKFIRLPNIFNFNKDETFSDNSKFMVENESFRIKLKLKDN